MSTLGKVTAFLVGIAVLAAIAVTTVVLLVSNSALTERVAVLSAQLEPTATEFVDPKLQGQGVTEVVQAETPVPTQTPFPTATPMPANTPAPTAVVPSVNTQWFTAAGIPQSGVVTIKPGRDCQVPAGCNVLAEPGVRGVDNYEEAVTTTSSVWTGSHNHYILDSIDATGAVLVPEASYATGFARRFRMRTQDGLDIMFNPCDSVQGDCGSGFVVRGLFDGEGDRHVSVLISEFGAPGAMGVTRYPVPVEEGEYFSFDYMMAQVVNALLFDNCGATGCPVFFLLVLDLNDGSMSVLRYDGSSWTTVWTNVAQYGPTAS